MLLSVWAVTYEIALTLLPGWLDALPFRGIAADVIFVLAGLLLIGRGLGGERGWVLIGIGAVCWASGDIYWTLALSNLANPPVPSLADVGYLSFCPFAFTGILSLVRSRMRAASKALVADAFAAALAMSALGAALVLQPVMAHADGGSLAIATNLAYPIFDLLLLGLIVGATALGNWQLNRTWILLACSVVAFWIADSIYVVADATGTYTQGDWYNALWYWSPVFAAWAAWLPRGARLPVQNRIGARGIVMPVGFAAVAMAVLVWSSFDRIGVTAIALATASLSVVMARLVLTWRDNARLLRASRVEAMVDSLTGLGNRRALIADLEHRLSTADAARPFTLVLFDLDGFKQYNDNFGHPAGDTLLRRLGRNLESQLGANGKAYRVGGDEFCALVDAPPGVSEPDVEPVAAALFESGDGFMIGCSYGSALLPGEAQDVSSALRIADQRMYAQKRVGRISAAQQSKDVLLCALAERSADLGTHVRDVADLAAVVAATFSLRPDEVEAVRLAAELHDVGKVAIPDAILDKPAALDEAEWAFIRRHTLVGERIIAAAPDLVRVAKLVRSSHENYDGTGYPDGLTRQEIPLGARIIAVCDAFDAMTTDRPYRKAMDHESAAQELRRCAGTQFDPVVVERFALALTGDRHALARVA
ncbi:MAG TPA: diguanylate cyclase [Solirubrobacteraceae bacterium]|nr:diguanylate cyclase [Solirubrobacteraceae bacterium]